MDYGKIILRSLAGLGVFLYVAGVIYAIDWSVKSPTLPVPEIVDYYVLTASTALATFLGMVMGFKQTGRGVQPATLPPSVSKAITLDWMQVIIAFIYLGSLILALGAWGYLGFATGVALLLQNLTKSLIGLMVGAITVYLNVK